MRNDSRSFSEKRCNNLPKLPIRVHFVAWAAIVLVTLALVWSTQGVDGRIWSGWAESRELRRPAYAERVQVEAISRTRANVWSNLAYVLVGFYAFTLGWHDWRSPGSNGDSYLRKTPALSLAFGLACCYLGVGSGLFHASLTRFGQQLDVAAIYSPLLVLIAISFGRWVPSVSIFRQHRMVSWPALVVLVVCASWLLFQYKWSMSSTTVLGTLIATVTLSCVLDQLRRDPNLDERWLIASFAALAIGVACRQLDIAGRFSGPDAWMQGHALWHVLTSLSLAFMMFYFRSETHALQRSFTA